MKSQRSQMSLQHAQRVFAEHLTSLQGKGRSTLKLHRATIQQFLQNTSLQNLDESHLMEWLIQDMPGRPIAAACRRLGIIARFLEELVNAGLLSTNFLAELRTHYGNASWRVLAQTFQATDPRVDLAVLARPEPHGPIEEPMQSYLALQHSLGKVCNTHRVVLQNLNRFLRLQDVDSSQAITPELLRCWLKSLPCQSSTRHEYLGLVNRFFKHLKQSKVVAVNPATVVLYDLGRRPPPKLRPFIFTHEQIVSILSQAQRLQANARFPLRRSTCHTMLALLYGLGLRHGETRHLQVRDLDLGRQTLFIRETKFHKSRYVPFGPKIGQCLERFLDLRRTILIPLRDDDPIFVASTRAAIVPNVLRTAFRSILKELQIATVSEARLPHLHDLRHTFAVHRLLRWYRENVDVQSRLMALSTFLGHLDPSYTQVYLTITADLLQEANERFYKHCGQTLNEELHP